MILGMSTATYTSVHVFISLVALASGFVVLFGLISRKRLDVWNALFLATTVATSVSGYAFPSDHLRPSHIVGLISLVVLTIAIAARYVFHLLTPWGRIYAVCASIALYLNVFVAIVQAFEKTPSLRVWAPTQSEPPFLLAQLSVLVIFATLGTLAARGSRARAFRPA
jgi:hypothetical protein